MSGGKPTQLPSRHGAVRSTGMRHACVRTPKQLCGGRWRRMRHAYVTHPSCVDLNGWGWGQGWVLRLGSTNVLSDQYLGGLRIWCLRELREPQPWIRNSEQRSLWLQSSVFSLSRLLIAINRHNRLRATRTREAINPVSVRFFCSFPLCDTPSSIDQSEGLLSDSYVSIYGVESIYLTFSRSNLSSFLII